MITRRPILLAFTFALALSACQGAPVPTLSSTALNRVELAGSPESLRLVDGSLYVLLAGAERGVYRRVDGDRFELEHALVDPDASRLLQSTEGLCVTYSRTEPDAPTYWTCRDANGAWDDVDPAEVELAGVGSFTTSPLADYPPSQYVDSVVIPAARRDASYLGVWTYDRCGHGGCPPLTVFFHVLDEDLARDVVEPLAELPGAALVQPAITPATADAPEMLWVIGSVDGVGGLYRVSVESLLEIGAR